MFEIRFPDRGDDESENGASRKKPRGSNRSRARRRAAHKPDFHKLAFEPLEPRVVFSASPFDSENFHASDTIAPQVLSLVGNSPNSPTNASSLVYTLTFSEAVTGVDTTDFAFIASAGVTANSTFVVSAVSSSVYTVTVSGITGNGTLRLDLRDDGSIRDLAGNQLPSDIVQQSIGVGATPYGLALGDLNGDGKLDIVTEGGPTDTVAVMLGNGDGTFGAQQTFGLGLAVPPITFAIGDVDGDGKADILSTGANRVTVLLGNGDGTFQVPRTSGLLDWEPKNVSFGDFNADGKLDFVFAARYGSVQVAFGNGNGTFANPQQQSAPDSEAARGLDVDGDGKLDIVSVSQPNGLVNVLLGNGNGTFKPQQTYAVRLGSQALTAGDFNGDGKLDLATSNDFDGSLSVLLGNGNGTFQSQRSIVAGVEPMSIRACDFNGDGRVDLAFVNTTDAGPGTLKILLGNGDGTFFNPQTMPTGVRTFRLETGDFNGDGKSDIVVANVQDGTLGINLNVARPAYTGQTYTIDQTPPVIVSFVRTTPTNTSTGSATVSYTLTFSAAVTGLSAADFFVLTTDTVATTTLDVTPTSGSVYVVTVGGISGNGTLGLKLYYNANIKAADGTPLDTAGAVSTLAAPSAITNSGFNRIAVVGDLNGDGKLDGVFGGFGGINVMLGNGNGTFQTSQSFSNVGNIYDARLADYNGDGKLDLVTANTANNSIGLFVGNGNGTFKAQQTYAVGPSTKILSVGDFDGDGKLDVASGNYSTSVVSVLLGNGNGTLQPTAQTTSASNPRTIAAGDFNGDSKLDIVTSQSGASIRLLLGNGTGKFTAGQTFAVGTYTRSIAAGDLNGDGKLDLVVGSFQSGLSVLLGNGNGTFQARIVLDSSSGADFVVVGDLNGDGKPDVTYLGTSANRLTTLFGNGDGTFDTRQTYATYSSINATLGDFNNDGRADVLVGKSNQSPLHFGTLAFFSPTYTIDMTLATLQSIERATPSDSTTNAASVSYIVTFGATVTGVDAADFAVTKTGTLSYSSLTVSPVSGTVYTVTIGGLAGGGTLGLTLVDDGSIRNTSGNGLNTFRPTSQDFSVSQSPDSVLRADLNGDGIADLVTANKYSASLSVLLGNGDGTFKAQQTIAAGTGARTVRAADLNGDGKLDLVVGASSGTSLGLLLGNGNGTFQARQTINTSGTSESIEIGDVNGDGILDIVVAGAGFSSVRMHFGNGNGTFKTWQNFAAGVFNQDLKLADVNNDGKLDLVIGESTTNGAVSVFLNNGNATFQSRLSFYVGTAPTSIAVADFNGDGKLDVATANFNFDSVSVLLGNGNGTFQAQQTYAVGDGPNSVVVGDANGDGIADLAVTSQFSHSLGVFLGNGNGTFQQARSWVSSYPKALSLGDFNGDGAFDIVTANRTTSNLTVFLGLPHSTVIGPTYTVDRVAPKVLSIARVAGASTATSATTAAFTVTFDSTVTGVDVADFVTAMSGTAVGAVSQVTPVSGTVYTVVVSGVAGEGTLGLNLVDDGSIRDVANNRLDTTGSVQTFQVQKTFATGGGPAAIAYGDFNGDGRADLVYSHVGENVSALRLGNGDGTFQAPLTFGFATQSLAVADLNADGKLDIVELRRQVGQSTVVVFLGNGNGTFQSGRSFAAGSSAQSAVLKDLNADGKLDVAVVNYGDNTVGVLLGNGDGNFQSQQTYAAGNGTYGIAIGDVNGDGKPDLIAANRVAMTVSILLGNGDGTFGAQQTAAVGDVGQEVATADFNGDGKLDLLVADTFSDKISILFGNGNGSFQTPQTYDVGAEPQAVFTADVDADGLVDLVVVAHQGVNVFKSNGNGTFQARQLYRAGDLPVAGTVGDLNGDGRLDVAVTNLQDDTVGVLLGAASFLGAQYTIEHVSPSLVSLVRTTPTSVATNASSVSFTATFDEDMTGVVASRFALSLNGVTTSSLSVTPVSGSVYTITVGGIVGSGTLGLRLVDDGSVRDLAGNRLRSFQTQQSVAVGAGPWTMASGDFDRDGNIDLVVAEQEGDSLGLLFGNGDGTFRARQSLAVADLPSSVVVADFNGDGKLDLSASIAYSNLISVRLGNGDGTFQAERTIPFDGLPISMKAADFNGDGKTDLALAGLNTDKLSVFFGNGDGEFLAPLTFAVGTTPSLVSIGDLNGDGRPDLIVAARGDSSATVLLADGDGFVRRDPFYFSVYPISLALSDFNGDGKLDLVKTDTFSGVVSLILGVGDGTFQQAQSLTATANPTSIAAADLNADGKADLVVLDYLSHNVSLMLGNGDGTFVTERIPVALSSSVNPFELVDLNHDGLIDITFASYGDNAVATLLNGSGGTFAGQSYTIDQTAPTVTGIYARGVGSGSANWNASFLAYLAANDLGDASLGYMLSSGATQLKTLSWSNVNTISIRFSEELTIAQGDLSVIGAANGPAVPAITGFAWDAASHVGTWTFAAALPRGKFLLHLGGTLLDTVGNALDGEWTVSSSTSSGNGTAGGDFNFRFNVLPGDFDGNNGVTITEVLAARNRAGKGTASVGYAYREDIDGNGNITITEVLQSRNRTATSITGLNEPVAPGSTPQSPLEIAPLVPGEEDGLYVSPYAALTEAELAPIVDEAIARWEASGLVPQDFDWSKLRFAITDLGPAYLGLGNPDGAILLDDDGAGWGWFVDGSPSEDGEFASSNTDAAAVAHMDLLTVVMHEIGHALGYPTGSAQDTPAAALMSEFLGVGARRTPGVAPAEPHHEPDLAPADLLAAGSFASAGAGPSLTNWSAAVAPSSQDYAIYALSSFTAENIANIAQPDDAAKPRANKSRRWP